MRSDSSILQRLKLRFKTNRENIVLFAACLFCLCFLFAGIESHKYKLLVIPFVALITPFLIIYPRLFIVCFIGSFFFENNLFVFSYHYSAIFINLQDVLGMLFVAGYSAKYLFKKGARETQPDLPIGRMPSRIVQFLFVFLFFCLISFAANLNSFSGIDAVRSIVYLAHLVELIVVFIIVTRELSFADKDFLVNVIIVFSLGELLIVGYQFFSAWLHGSYYFRDVSGLYEHHCQIGNMLTISIACSVYKMYKSRSMRGKITYIIISFLFCWAIICSGSRSNLVGIMCAVVMLILSKFRFHRRYILALLGVAVISLFLILFSPFKHLTDFTFKSEAAGIDMSSYQRIFIWKGAWEHFVHAPLFTKLFGVGIGNYSNLKYTFILDTGDKAISGAHNNFLHVLSETGILGGVFFIGVFLSIFFGLWRAGKKDTFAFLFRWVTIALLISGMTQETFWFQISFGNFWVYYMIGLGMAFSCHPSMRTKGQSLMKKSLPSGLFAS
jgi:O-antigen ligase